MNSALRKKNEQMIEIEYKDESGQCHFQDVQGWDTARLLAKEIAKKTKRIVRLRPAPRRRWLAYVVSTDGSRQVIRSEHKFTRAEAIELWKEWKPIRDGSVCVLWPEWAAPISSTFAEANWEE